MFVGSGSTCRCICMIGEKQPELGPAHEQIRSRYPKVGVLVSADIVASDCVAAHRCRKPGDDYARQTICLSEVGLVVAGPAARKGLRAGEAAASEQEPTLLQNVPNGPVILQSVTIARFSAGAAVGVRGRGRDIGVWAIARLAIIGLEPADGGFCAARARNDPGISQES